MQFHVELGTVDGWWRWDDGVQITTYDLKGANLRRWPD
jgi:hypothetical protein